MFAVVARFTPFFFHWYADGVSESDLVMLLLAERLDYMTDCKNFLLMPEVGCGVLLGTSDMG